MAFNPQEHISVIKGKQYLEVKWRIAWFRDVHPNGRISTHLIQTTDFMIVQATVIVDNEIIAEDYGTAPAYNNGQSTWKGREIEKASTAAIGRALAIAGFGTQFTGDEWDEGEDLADSPVAKKSASLPEQSSTEPQYVNGVAKLMTKQAKNKPMYIIGGASMFQLNALRAIFPDLDDKPFHQNGEHFLPGNVTVKWEANGKYKNVVALRNDKTGEVAEVTSE